MKRIILTIIIIAISLCKLMAQNDAMYIYRNDGIINAFLKYDVDSIKHSHIDIDSTYCKDFIVQEVWTADSVYRIPLSVIDSVSFVTPPTVYKNDVRKIEDNLLPYVIGVDSLTLKLRADIPSSIIPKVGNKLVLLKGCDVLPDGFSGIVSKIESTSSMNSINIVCKQAYIEDLFDSFCNVSTTYGDANGNLKTRNVSNDGIQRSAYKPSGSIFKLGPFTKNCTNEISLGIASDGELALQGGTNSSVTIQPTFRIHSFLIVGERYGTYFNCSITGNLEVTSNESVYGGINYSHDFRNTEYRYPIPQTANLVNFYIMPGLFFRANAVITASIKATRNYSFGMAFDYSSINGCLIKPALGGHLSSQSTEMDGCIDGSIAAGAFIETGFNLASRDIAKACVRGEYGYQLSSNFVLRNEDVENSQKETKLYERLKSSSIAFGPFANASFQASVATLGISKSWELSKTSEKRNIVPIFSNTKFTYDSFNSAKAFTEMSGKCMLPLTVGYKLYDENHNEVADYSDKTNYTSNVRTLSHTFINLNLNTRYTIYPKVNIWKYNIIANPKADIINTMAEITEFKVINSEYSNSSFYDNGKAYDYKFNVAVTAKIKDLTGIEDWGYIYEDSNGNFKRVSLMKFGKSYTDTRYSYYRNEISSTVTLYCYVLYNGYSDYLYTNAQEYSLIYSTLNCPDSNHPHVIDLGLPSGTKWACCNIGASEPTQKGEFYAWGELEPKDIYGCKTYKYCHPYYYENAHIVKGYEFEDIGSDISGSQYDVAHMKWGGNWKMPTKKQIQELVDFCSFKWSSSGKSGVYLIGPNGGNIYFPAGNFRTDSTHARGGCWIWSSTLVSEIEEQSLAYILLYGRNGAFYNNWDTAARSHGLNVRAVIK